MIGFLSLSHSINCRKSLQLRRLIKKGGKKLLGIKQMWLSGALGLRNYLTRWDDKSYHAKNMKGLLGKGNKNHTFASNMHKLPPKPHSLTPFQREDGISLSRYEKLWNKTCIRNLKATFTHRNSAKCNTNFVCHGF